MFRIVILTDLLVIIFITSVTCQSYKDRRCICICPNPASILNESVVAVHRPYIADVPPSQCNCDGVMLMQVGDQIKGHEQEFCFRCDCKYEIRNTSVIKVVVIMVLWILTLLLFYMGFLICLDPLMKRKKRYVYQPISNDEVQNFLDTHDSNEELNST